MTKGFQFLHLLANICCVWFCLYIGGCEMVSHCDFDLSVDVSTTWGTFLGYFLASYVSSLEKFLFKSIAQFLVGVLVEF